MEEKRSRGRPRKYKTRAALLKARRGWAKAWRLSHPERWQEIQRRSDHKRRHRKRTPKRPPELRVMPGVVHERLQPA